MSVKGSIGIRDNVTAVLRAVKREQSSFRKDVEATKKAMQKAYEKKREFKVRTKPASKAIGALIKKMNPLRKKLAIAIAVKDMLKDKLKVMGAKLKSFGKMTAKPVIAIKNKVGKGLSRVKNSLSSLVKGVSIPVTIALAGGLAGLSKVLKGGMKFEEQKMSIEHFVGATNKDMDKSQVKAVSESFMKDLRKNANATPFETGEVVQAGSRAIAIASGNTKEAMNLVKLAEDMAAASGGTKNISQAIEALADAKMGEMERLKEFGFKVSKEEFNSKGFEGVAGDLKGFYGGASEKLALSGSGIISTIKGKLKSNFDDFGLKLLNKLKPLFSGVVSLIDKYSPYFDEFGTNLADGIMGSIKKIKSFVPGLVKIFNKVKPIANNLYNSILPVVDSIKNTFKEIAPVVLPVVSSISKTLTDVFVKATPIVSEGVQIIGSIIKNFAPVFKKIFDDIGSKVSSVTEFVASKMGFVHKVIDFAFPLISDVITTSWKIISPIMDFAIGTFKTLCEVVEFVFPAVKATVETAWGFLKPIFEGIAKGIESLGRAIGKLKEYAKTAKDFVTGDNLSPEVKKLVLERNVVGKNALGTDNWKGGLTWVGENGAELVDLPKGSRILPNKSSMRLMDDFKNKSDNGKLKPRKNEKIEILGVLNTLPNKSSADSKNDFKIPEMKKESSKVSQTIKIELAKIADSIIVRDDSDIEKIAEKVGEIIAKEVEMAMFVNA